MKKYIILLNILILIGCQTNYEYKNGDIIFQTSLSSQSKALQIATKSKYSHMGIIYIDDNKAYVYEAVQPVKITPMTEWINRGENKKYIVKRLKDRENILTDKNLKKMKEIGEKYIDKDYDLYFEWSDDRIYCSELVWKIYKEALNIELGELQRISDFDLSNPIVKDKIRERFGDNLPKDEIVISPESIFNSDLLITVFSNY